MDHGGHHGAGADVEAPKDPGALKTHTSFTDNEIQGHRNVFVGIHLPGRSARKAGLGPGGGGGGSGGHHHSRGSRPHRHRGGRHLKAPNDENRPGN